MLYVWSVIYLSLSGISLSLGRLAPSAFPHRKVAESGRGLLELLRRRSASERAAAREHSCSTEREDALNEFSSLCENRRRRKSPPTYSLGL